MPISNTSYQEQSTLQRRALKRKQMLKNALERQRAIRKVKSLGHADYRQGRGIRRQAMIIAPRVLRRQGFSIATGLAGGTRSRAGAVNMGRARTWPGFRSETSVFQTDPGQIITSPAYRWTTSGHQQQGPGFKFETLNTKKRRRPASFLNLRHRLGARNQLGGAR